MSSIDGVSGPPATQVDTAPLIEIAVNIGELISTVAAGALTAEELVELTQPETSALDPAPNENPALSLAGLRPPTAGLANVDPDTIQSIIRDTVDPSSGSVQRWPNMPARPLLQTARQISSSPPDVASRSTAADSRSVGNALVQLAMNPALQTERAGVIASFILNAGLIPALPAPPAPVPAQALSNPAAAVVPPGQIDDEAALTYLANLGADQALIEKIRKMSRRPVPGKRVLVGLAALMTALTVVTEAIAEEIATLAEDWHDNEENRSLADSRGHSARRRLYLE